MHHNAVNNPSHKITLRIGDRIKARRFTAALRQGDLYEVIEFHDLPFPRNDASTTRLLNVTQNSRLSIRNDLLQAAFVRGDWALA